MSTVVSPECWWRNETRAGICWGVGGCGCAACSVQKRRSLGFPSQREVRTSQKFPWWSSVHETYRWVGGMSVGEDYLCMLRGRGVHGRGVHGRGGAKDGPSRRMELRIRPSREGWGEKKLVRRKGCRTSCWAACARPGSRQPRRQRHGQSNGSGFYRTTTTTTPLGAQDGRACP